MSHFSRCDDAPCCFFFFNDTATTEIYTLSLHDALPIFQKLARATGGSYYAAASTGVLTSIYSSIAAELSRTRSEEHTSELQSLAYLVCRLLLEKKKTPPFTTTPSEAVRSYVSIHPHLLC